jgi:hypothetical protein
MEWQQAYEVSRSGLRKQCPQAGSEPVTATGAKSSCLAKAATTSLNLARGAAGTLLKDGHSLHRFVATPGYNFPNSKLLFGESNECRPVHPG